MTLLVLLDSQGDPRNFSYEIAGPHPGQALSWVITAESILREQAEFSIAVGETQSYVAAESLELDWRAPASYDMPYNRPFTGGGQDDWGTLNAPGGFVAAAGPAFGFVQEPYIEVDALTATADFIVTVTYTNTDGDVGQTATVTIPSTALPGSRWALTLEPGDIGFVAVTGMSAPAAFTSGSLEVQGLFTQNDWGRFVADPAGGAGTFEFEFGPPVGQGFVAVPVIRVVDVDVVSTADVVLTITYVNEQTVFSRVGTVTIPNGAEPGREYVIQLQGDDRGFESITNIVAAPNMTSGILEVRGSWIRDPLNQLAKFAFDDSPTGDLFPIALPEGTETFEAAWGLLTGFGFINGLRDNFDALESELATISGSAAAEAFEKTWKLPQTPDAAPYNEDRTFALVPWVDSQEFASGASIIITFESNDRFQIEFPPLGTSAGPVEVILAPGTYTVAALATEIETKTDAALTAAPGLATGAHFSAITVTTLGGGSVIRMITTYSPNPMIITDTARFSVLSTLGITGGVATTRNAEADAVGAALFDVANDAFEDFEEEWRDNQDSVFAFTGPDLGAALFDVANVPQEDFETEWTLTL